MYDEEYFIALLKPIGASALRLEDALFYKYFGELSQEQLKQYDFNDVDQRYT